MRRIWSVIAGFEDGGGHMEGLGAASKLWKQPPSWQPARKWRPQSWNHNNPFNHLNEFRSTSSPEPPGRKAVQSMPWNQPGDALSRPPAVLELASIELGTPRSNYRLSSWLPLWSRKNNLASLSLSLLMVLVRIKWDAHITHWHGVWPTSRAQSKVIILGLFIIFISPAPL